MEYTPEICEKIHTKLDLFNKELNEPSESFLSPDPGASIGHVELFPRKFGKRKLTQAGQVKRDFLQRIFDKKKLKDKSLSKKMKTPFDRKLNRTSWPIQLSKISKIKEKPSEKKKGKPTNRSLKKKKFSNPNFETTAGDLNRKTLSIKDSEIDILDEEFFDEMLGNLKDHHFLYEPVTPQMLIDVLKEPEHLKSGATLDMIIAKLRASGLDLNPTVNMLKREVLQKLYCAIKLGLVIEKKGYYCIPETLRMSKLPKKKVDAFWELWYRRVSKCESESDL